MKNILVVERDTKEFSLIDSKMKSSLADLLEESEGMLVLDHPAFSSNYSRIVVTDTIEVSEDFGRDLVKANGAANYTLRLKHTEESVGYGIARHFNHTKFWGSETEEPDEPIVSGRGGPIKLQADGVQFAKWLVNAPGNVLNPATYADIINIRMPSNVKVRVLSGHDIEDFGTLLSVAQGSDIPGRVVVMEYIGNPDKPIRKAFVGKGVTFDTGGISLKPGAKMHEMKTDMGGSAAVVGAIMDLAKRKIKTNIVGVIGLVENMPSGKAIKPGDVVTSLSGKTVENHNTDAEGRLVLCDLLTYVQDTYSDVDTIIDLATLTGAIVVSLGDYAAGLFSNSEDLSDQISMAGKIRGEKFWRMPMGKEFRKQLDSKVADIKNIGNGHPGSTTAAEFLYEFINPNIAWAHLDIAGVAYKDDAATAFGVETLVEFASIYDEDTFLIDSDMEY